MNTEEYKNVYGRERKRIKDNYCGQKSMAKKRGIAWEFTFETWLNWWGDDYAQRGQGRGKLCCARLGDTGPYSPTNCKKLTHEQNSLETDYTKRGTNKFKTYIPSKLKTYKPKCEYRARPIHTPKGDFPSIAEYSRQVNISTYLISKLLTSDPENYYFI